MIKKTIFLFTFGLFLQINAANTLAAEVLSSHLQNLQGQFNAHTSQKPASSFSTEDGTINIIQNQQVFVDISVKNLADVQPLLDKLKVLGATEIASFRKQVSALIPIKQLSQLKNYSEISWVSSNKPINRAVKTERKRGVAFNAADQAMFTDVVRKQYGVDGTGVSIGVMSDSFNCIDEKEELDESELDYALDIFTGDLPDDVTVLKEFPVCRDADGELLVTDEGRAMMQLIYDIAPGVKLYFYTASTGATAFAAGILALEEAGVDIIVDDLGYFNMPMFQEGPIAQAVNEVKKRGVTYFSAAGNGARYSYETNFTEGVVASRDKAHDFGRAAGEASDFYQQITIPLKQHIIISLQWDDPAEISGGEGAKTDLDFFLVNTEDGSIITSSENNNIGHNPIEIFAGSIVLFGDAAAEGEIQANLYISHRAGPVPKRIKYIYHGPTAPWPEDVKEEDKDKIVSISIDEYQTNSSTVFGHANASGAIAVGAIPYQQTPWFNTALAVSRIEPFSSAGGTPILFDNIGRRLIKPEIRFKPEIVAPDNSDTSFFGTNTDFNSHPNFQGTSASAPNAAALAVLLKQAYPDLTPDSIKLAMTQGSLNLNDPSPIIDEISPKNDACRVNSNFDFGTGCGLVQADLVFEQGSVFLSLDTSAAGITVGVPFEYHIKLKNFSDKDLQNSRIRALKLPEHVVFHQIDGCESIDDREVSCRLGTVPAGQIRDVVIKAVASQSPNGLYPFDLDLLTDTTDVDLSNTLVNMDTSVPSLIGDFNNDGCVDLSDWSVLFAAIRAGGAPDTSFDLNTDGVINSADLTELEKLYSEPFGGECK